MSLKDLLSTLSPEAGQIYDRLVKYAEGTSGETSNGARWWSVYLDNARPDDMRHTTFQAYLAVLSKAGLYKTEDNYAFGYVLTDKGLTPSP